MRSIHPTPSTRIRPDQVEVTLRGDLPERSRGWAREAVERAVRHESRTRLLRARVTLLRPAHPAEPCRADIAVDLNGRLLHARAEAGAARAALDLAAERLRGQAERLSDRPRHDGTRGSGRAAAGARARSAAAEES